MSDAAWRALAGDCAECGRELAFMEGPLCDPCVDANERLPAGIDPLARFRDDLAIEDEVDAIRSSACTVSFDAPPRLLVDLVAHRIVYAAGVHPEPPPMKKPLIVMASITAFVLALVACGGGWNDSYTKRATDAVHAQVMIESICSDAGACTPSQVRSLERMSYCANASMLAQQGQPVPNANPPIKCQAGQ